MLNFFEKSMRFLRARWRWTRGRCPRCNRHLYAALPSAMAGDANCPVRKGETATDLRMWHNHSTLATTHPNEKLD